MYHRAKPILAPQHMFSYRLFDRRHVSQQSRPISRCPIMPSSEDSPISPKLDILPRENISLWKESLEAAALAYCASHGPDGALGLACDAASWQARHAGAVIARPVYPDPGILAAAATPAERQRQAHATALVRFRDFSTAAAKLRKLALESVGDTKFRRHPRRQSPAPPRHRELHHRFDGCVAWNVHRSGHQRFSRSVQRQVEVRHRF